MEVKFLAFLTLALDGAEWPASLSSAYTPTERSPVTTG